MDRYLQLVFLGEGVVNSASFISLYFFPLFSLKMLGVPSENITPMLVNMTQWFASLLFVLGCERKR